MGPLVATITPYLVKAAVGFTVSKLVGGITGNDMLGAVAGGFVGMGIGFDSATGFTWDGIGGAAEAASTATETVAGGAKGLLSTEANTFLSDSGLGVKDLVNKPLVDPVGLNTTAPSAPVASTGDLTATLNKTSGAGLTESAKPSGFLDNIGGWVEKNKTLSKMAVDGLSGMLTPDAIDIREADWDYRSDFEKEKYDREHRAVNPADFTGGLKNVNETLSKGGYRPQYDIVMGGGYQPTYANLKSPNYQAMIDSIRDQKS